MTSWLDRETGTIVKKWKGRLPVALLYPNTYPLAVSNLGLQLVYHLLGGLDYVVCERFVYPEEPGPLRSLESCRPLVDFPVVLGSISFEHDYPRLIRMLLAGGLEPLAARRTGEVGPGSPLVVLGGVGVFMNPEPLAPFADLIVLGEAEPVLGPLIEIVDQALAAATPRRKMLENISSTLGGCYVPEFYDFEYGEDGRVRRIRAEAGREERVTRVIHPDTGIAAHSRLLSPDAELGMYMVELGRGCSRSCRFCAAGFIYRPPRLWSGEAIQESLEERPASVNRVGLLGMEMADPEVLDRITAYLHDEGCSLSFSSLRADRINDQLLALLAESQLKSVAIAPDGCSERLRRVINKNLTEEDLLSAAVALVGAGIVHLKLYVMIGLPTETRADLDEMISLVHRMHREILPLGRRRGRVTELTLSVNSFVPKPWTPFQYLPYGGLENDEASLDRTCSRAVSALKKKIKYLRAGLAGLANLRIKVDRPERVLQQAVFSRGIVGWPRFCWIWPQVKRSSGP
ncbi:radical SAM protein [Desulfolithobacter dissulfuricans]|uniref:Radical SAM protein n=1 Tax=Desulfolithobacter dissulfuricans TaxID=2795293 RepID=A0A915U1W2_9BACT|nr:radical SAM protein [Desulfolithobacter dissulfuricans]BCO09684.1 radical SAM protein [Desulfolithobacter dissulfuricans]